LSSPEPQSVSVLAKDHYNDERRTGSARAGQALGT